MELLPYKIVEYRNSKLKEFDLDAALSRKPSLLCVDELAHSNTPGMRHPKRWQYVAELLDAGINVYTTLNMQHLESINDIVERNPAMGILGFGCSPLSCNGMAESTTVNDACLIDELESALAAARRFAVEQPEPGPFVVIEVLAGIASPVR